MNIYESFNGKIKNEHLLTILTFIMETKDLTQSSDAELHALRNQYDNDTALALSDGMDFRVVNVYIMRSLNVKCEITKREWIRRRQDLKNLRIFVLGELQFGGKKKSSSSKKKKKTTSSRSKLK